MWTSSNYEIPMKTANHTLGMSLYNWYNGLNQSKTIRYIDAKEWPSNAPCSQQKMKKISYLNDY